MLDRREDRLHFSIGARPYAAPPEFAELLSLTPVSARAKAELRAAMCEARRFYHNVGHLAQLWRRHRRYASAEGFDNPWIERLIAGAIAYHDSVYDMGRRDNEERSAERWLAACPLSRLAEDDRQWVAGTIRATKDHLGYNPCVDIEHPPAGDGDILKERARVWVLDLDLSPLGDIPESFDRNTAHLRKEAAGVADSAWRTGQLQFLSRLLDAPKIFRIPTLCSHYETQARRNIERLMHRLSTH